MLEKRCGCAILLNLFVALSRILGGVPRKRVRLNVGHTFHGLDHPFLITQPGRFNASEWRPLQAITWGLVHIDSSGL